MKAVLSHGGTVVTVTASRRNLERVLQQLNDGKVLAGIQRQGDMRVNEPTVVLIPQEDEEHYVEASGVGPARADSDVAELLEEMKAVLLETDEMLQASEDPGTPRFFALLDRLKDVNL